MSLHHQLVEVAAGMDVPEGFRADAKGEVIVVSSQRPEHWNLILEIAFRVRLADSALITTSDVKIAGTGDNDKAPDVAIFRTGDVLHARNALAFFEVVSPSSIEADYIDKAGIYAAAGVAEYLIVDPAREMWTLHTGPADGAYQITNTKPINTPVHVAGIEFEL
ncbi:Uma2 family endonuclease [Nocardia sp. NPDC006630]|uniref:Uma2 family endonuclease n=1 Tax=Nocardia sp. NPDC006630 TaxID=3157181 RepID=UPI0033AAEE4B